jgi:hypothetical protein
MNWTDLALDRSQWRDLVNTVMNFRFHKILGTSIASVAEHRLLWLVSWSRFERKASSVTAFAVNYLEKQITFL